MKKILICTLLACSATTLTAKIEGQTPSLLEKPLSQLLSSVHSRAIGTTSLSKVLTVNLSLPLSNEGQLDEFLQAVNDPTNSAYHQFLSPTQFTTLYGPKQADYKLLIAWAKDNGLALVEVPANRSFLGVQGSVSQMNSLFHVALHDYVDTDTGRTFFAPDVEPTPSTPVALLAITGLDTIIPKQHHTTPLSASAPVSSATGSGSGGNFTPQDIRRAYYGSGSLTGTGQYVAIFSYDGYLNSDLTLYYNAVGISSPPGVTNILVNGYSGACTNVVAGTSTCSDGEQIIDIGNVAGIAPGLNGILFYEGTSSTSILNQIVSDNTASVISSSWSGGDFGSSSENIFKQMQAQGMTYLNASGDNGAYATTPYAPALSPSIAEVGGTDLTTTGAGGSYVSETAWSSSGGGWITNTFSIPSWQANAINSANSGSTSWRNSPDVAAEGNNDNILVDNGTVYYGSGGTSYAAPRWAALLGLANQQAAANCESTVGFLPTRIYPTLNTSTYSSIFHDIASGNNANGSVSYNAVGGYDLITGLGSPQGPSLINYLVPLHSSPTSTQVSLSYSSGGPPTTFSARVLNASSQPITGGSVTFTYAPYYGGGPTTACSASVVSGNASCTKEVYDNTGQQYHISASYGGTLYLGANACQASSATISAISLGYGFN